MALPNAIHSRSASDDRKASVEREPFEIALRILDALDVARDVDIEPSVARLSDHVSDEWVDRFKREAR